MSDSEDFIKILKLQSKFENTPTREAEIDDTIKALEKESRGLNKNV